MPGSGDGPSVATVERIMRHVPTVTIEDLAKVYVRESDVREYLDTRERQ